MFVLALCKAGAERAVVAESGLPRAYSRPGLVTLKGALERDLVFAHYSGVSLGKVASVDEAIAKAGAVDVVHAVPGSDVSALKDGDRVLTVVELVDDKRGSERWAGVHTHGPGRSPFPGGVFPEALLPADAPSRAWLKLEEAARTFRLDLKDGERAIEIGSAPGGAAWNLLERGLEVIGVDPNLMDPRVADHPSFSHLRRVSMNIDAGSISPVQWILLDVNVPPNTALRGALPFVTAHAKSLRGIVFTLKLKDWSLAPELPGWLDRIAHAAPLLSLRARQLSSNGQELCVVGVRR